LLTFGLDVGGESADRAGLGLKEHLLLLPHHIVMVDIWIGSWGALDILSH
tara:strand:- start:52 stop:201 length:150 start_codon:yes stop_codon:yes gene_type:complete